MTLAADLYRLGELHRAVVRPTFVVALKNNVIWLVLYMLAVPFGLFVALFLNQT